MLSEKTFGSIVLVGALLATAACGDSSKSLNPTAPSAVAAASPNVEATDATAESGTTAAGGNPVKPVNPGNGNGNQNGNGSGNDKGPSTSTPPANTSPGAPTAPVNPGTSKVEIEGSISAIAGTAITVNSRTVNVPVTAVIRFGQRAVAFSELSIGDRVHVRARIEGAVLEATEVKLQSPDGGNVDGDDDSDEDGGTVWVSVVDATAAETGTDQGRFRLTRVASAALPLTSPLVVTLTLTGTATNGVDYTNVPLTATFLAGQATVDVVVAPIADALAEGSETVILTLASVAPFALGSPTSGIVTIADAAPVVSVVALDATASETGPDLGTFRFSRTGALTSSLTVTYTVTGTAVNGTDYQAIPVTVTFLAGQATADVFVIPIADGITEAAETVIVTLTDGASYDLGAPATATATVTITG
ncbi:MAG: Calx-beta domain-containing protein [Acidobacteriota bacterium]|nr:Calx-beta domain-containing protein [Acidobacteriota bacterium]